MAAFDRGRRRISTRRHVELACQAVRLEDFTLLSDRIVDLSAHGMLVPTRGAARASVGDEVIVSFEITGIWIDAEAVVSRVIHGLRPWDDGPALGLSFVALPAASRAALAGFLHGRPPPLPRRGPFARLRRGEGAPRLGDELDALAEARQVLTLDELPVEPPASAQAEDFRVLVLRALASAWRGLGEDATA